MDTASDPRVIPNASRRTLLASTAGVAGAALLAGCSQTHHKGLPAGLSGATVPSTSVPPTVPVTKPSAASIEADTNTMATANSLELLLAEVYTTYGPKLSDADLKAAAERFAADHTAAAEVFASQAPGHPGLGKPNEYLQANQVDPVADLLTTDDAITGLMSSLESSVAATYAVAVSTLLDPEWRETTMTYGAAAARRSTLLGNGGAGSTPTQALLPLSDLISTKAFLIPTTTTAPA